MAPAEMKEERRAVRGIHVSSNSQVSFSPSESQSLGSLSPLFAMGGTSGSSKLLISQSPLVSPHADIEGTIRPEALLTGSPMWSKSSGVASASLRSWGGSTDGNDERRILQESIPLSSGGSSGSGRSDGGKPSSQNRPVPSRNSPARRASFDSLDFVTHFVIPETISKSASKGSGARAGGSTSEEASGRHHEGWAAPRRLHESLNEEVPKVLDAESVAAKKSHSRVFAPDLVDLPASSPRSMLRDLQQSGGALGPEVAKSVQQPLLEISNSGCHNCSGPLVDVGGHSPVPSASSPGEQAAGSAGTPPRRRRWSIRQNPIAAGETSPTGLTDLTSPLHELRSAGWRSPSTAKAEMDTLRCSLEQLEAVVRAKNPDDVKPGSHCSSRCSSHASPGSTHTPDGAPGSAKWHLRSAALDPSPHTCTACSGLDDPPSTQTNRGLTRAVRHSRGHLCGLPEPTGSHTGSHSSSMRRRREVASGWPELSDRLVPRGQGHGRRLSLPSRLELLTSPSLLMECDTERDEVDKRNERDERDERGMGRERECGSHLCGSCRGRMAVPAAPPSSTPSGEHAKEQRDGPESPHLHLHNSNNLVSAVTTTNELKLLPRRLGKVVEVGKSVMEVILNCTLALVVAFLVAMAVAGLNDHGSLNQLPPT